MKRMLAVLMCCVLALGVPGTVLAAGTEAGVVQSSTITDANGFVMDEAGCLVGYTGNAKDIVIPSNVSSIGAHAFEGKSIASVKVPGSVKQIGEYAFASTGISKVELAEGVQSIGLYAFAARGSINESYDPYFEPHFLVISIPTTVTDIGAGAFYTRVPDKYGQGFSAYPYRLTIYGQKGSYAERYAKERDAIFMERNERPITGITLNTDDIRVDVGGTMSGLRANISPWKYMDDGTITWSSSNSAIASIDSNGVITGVAPGTIRIKAETSNGYRAYAHVIVSNPITSVAINQGNTSVPEGAQVALSAAVTPANTTSSKAFSWSSSNTSVATVDNNGIVTGHNAGNTTITVTTANGKKASCRVDVTRPITEVVLSEKNVSLSIGKTAYLKTTILPATTTDYKTISWSSSNASVATVTKGNIKAVAQGTAVITATASNGVTATCVVTVNK